MTMFQDDAKAAKLAELAVRGDSEGERRAAMTQLAARLSRSQPPPTKPVKKWPAIGAFGASAILAHLLWSWGFWGCLFIGIWAANTIRTLQKEMHE